MRRIPGTGYFVTVTTNLSPSDFHLYQVTPGGADVVFVNESPYHGDIAATMTFAFNGTPPTHMVNVDGLLLRFFGDGCSGMTNSFTSGYFVKDGSLGTLPTGQWFRALANDDTGRLFAITGATPATRTTPPCARGGATSST